MLMRICPKANMRSLSHTLTLSLRQCKNVMNIIKEGSFEIDIDILNYRRKNFMANSIILIQNETKSIP